MRGTPEGYAAVRARYRDREPEVVALAYALARNDPSVKIDRATEVLADLRAIGFVVIPEMEAHHA